MSSNDIVCSDILLLGQPNVGKSVLFSRITGISAVSSNYAGTTVTYTSGCMRFDECNYQIIDAPGIYSLEPIDQVARVAVDLIDDAKRIINVVDATHLERHLPLTMELIEQKIPMVVALNMSDEARHRGIKIDEYKLEKLLGVPVVSIVARTGEGVKDLVSRTLDLKVDVKRDKNRDTHPAHHPHISSCRGCGKCDGETIHQNHIHIRRKDVWAKIGEMTGQVQTLTHRHHTFGEWLEDLSVHPIWGALIAAIVLFVSLSFVRLMGEFLIGGGLGIFGDPWFELPFGTELLFDKLWLPVMEKLSVALGEGGFWHQLLVGNLIDGKIDLVQSFGILTSGLFVPVGAVLPYVLSFYFIMSLLEDSGYLPRLAIFMDNIMHKVGLHGYAIIPTLLGLGCNVPGIMATRILETKAQRFVTATLISIAIPCAALQAMIIGFVGKHGFAPVALIYGVLISTWFIVGIVLRVLDRGEERPELLIEMPPYRLPMWGALFLKMRMRIGEFVKEALPIVSGSILLVNFLYYFNLFEVIADFFAPLITNLWGMPKEAIVPLFIGILRKDVAVGMFGALDLSLNQLIVGCVVLAMFFPCIATFAILFRELGVKDALKSTMVMLIVVISVGTLLNWFL